MMSIMKQWYKFRIFGISFLFITCSFISWVAFQDNIQVWQILVATALVFIALILTFINRRLEQKAKQPTDIKGAITSN